MTNTTKNTTKSIFLALSVALTMGAANATSVPGIGTNVFEFSKPGVDASAIVVGTGVDAIDNMNAILAAVGTTGGSTLDQANFWGSSVAKTEVDVFEYDAAAPMIEELIFIVKGEAYDTDSTSSTRGTYIDAGQARTEGGSTAKADFLQKASNTGTGSYIDGKLSHTKVRAVELMEMLKFTVSDKALNWASNNTLQGSSDANNPTDNPTNDVVIFTGPEQAVELNKITDGTSTTNADGSVTYNNDSTLEQATFAASLNKEAFVNANNLVGLIASELKTGYILDVDKAAANLSLIAGHHTGFLSASLVNKAHDLKAVIKNIGYLEASVGVGKGARVACVDTSGSTNKTLESCKAIGHKFQSLSNQVLSVTDAGTAADTYAATIVAINAFADDIISFNNTVDGFNPAIQAGLINDQFGTITVNTGSDLYTDLSNNVAPTEADIAGSVVASDIDGIFNTEFDLVTDLGDDNLLGGTGSDADTVTSIVME